MPSDPTPSRPPTATLIGGQYAVDFSRPLPGAGGGLDAYGVLDRSGARSPMMAVRSRPFMPPRGLALSTLAAAPIDSLLAPVAHGIVQGGETRDWFLICPPPPGPAIWPEGVASITPWSEAALLSDFLRPAAHALDRLDARRLTHRAVRPSNIFRASTGPVWLGNAWSAPPACLQPAVFEPPYSAACQEFGRSDGAIADDVYALGVTMLCLATGQMPLAGMAPGAIVLHLLEQGCFTALVGSSRLSPAIADLLSGMLAEHPEHRPTPAMLSDPAAARTRRISARPPHRAARPIDVGSTPAATVRGLAHAIGRDPAQGARLLRGGGIDTWLRRHLGDAALAVRLEDVTRQGRQDGEPGDDVADMMLAMRAVALLDPLAPLCWRGVAVWPGGLGPMLAEAARPDRPQTGPGGDPRRLVEAVRDMVENEILVAWGRLRPDRCDLAGLRMDAGQHRQWLRQRGWGGGMAALRYALNPMLPCLSPLLAGHVVVEKSELLRALDAIATRPGIRKSAPVDTEIGAFLAARQEPVAPDLAKIVTARDAASAALLQLRMLAGLQQRLHAPALHNLAAWLAELAAPSVAGWRSRTRRDRIAAALPQIAETGNLPAMLNLLEDQALLATDAAEAQSAERGVAAIDAELAALQSGGAQRRNYAERIGAEIATALAVIGLTASAVVLAVG